MSNIISTFSYYYNYAFIYYFIHKYLFEISFLEGESMCPTFNKNLTIAFIDKFSPIWFRPKINQIVVIKDPLGITNELCKRIKKIKTIEKEELIWLEGDNKINSFDSRNFGWIKKDFIKGNVIFEIFPKFRFLNNFNENQAKI